MALTTIDDRGLKTPIDLIDNEKIRFGTGNDLEIYHNGSHSYIKDAGTGNLSLMSGGAAIVLEKDNAEPMIVAYTDGAVELYHDNSKKLETYAYGVQFPGNIQLNTDTGKAYFGAGNDLMIYHDGSNSHIHQDGTGDLQIRSDNSIEFNTNGTENAIWCDTNGAVKLYYNNDLKFQTTNTGISVTGNISMPSGHLYASDNQKLYLGTSDDLQIYHDASNTYITNSTGQFAVQGDDLKLRSTTDLENYIVCTHNGAVALYHNGTKQLETASTGVQITGYLGFESTGKVIHLADSRESVFGTGEDLKIYHNGSHSYIDNTTGTLHIRDDSVIHFASTTNEDLARFDANGSCEFYYDNSSKARTYADGFHVKGDLWVDNQVNTGKDIWFDESANYLKFYDDVKASFGTADDFQIHHQSSYPRNVIESNGCDLVINATSTGGTNEKGIAVAQNAQVELYYDNSKKLETYSSGAGLFGFLKLGLENGTGYKSRIGVTDIVNQGSSYASLASTGLGGLAFIQVFNDSGGAQCTALVAWRAGSHSVIHESDNTGLSIDYQVSGAALQIKTASGTVSGSCTYLISA